MERIMNQRVFVLFPSMLFAGFVASAQIPTRDLERIN